MSLFLVLVPSEFTARVRSRAATMDDLRVILGVRWGNWFRGTWRVVETTNKGESLSGMEIRVKYDGLVTYGLRD